MIFERKRTGPRDQEASLPAAVAVVQTKPGSCDQEASLPADVAVVQTRDREASLRLAGCQGSADSLH